jgi:uncharacterized membrane protein
LKKPKKASTRAASSKIEEGELLPPSNHPEPNGGLVRRTTAVWQGPILPPEILKKYDEVVPNGAARLFEQFEKEASHRREMEKVSLNYQGRDLEHGKRNALLFGFGVLSVMTFAIWMGAGWVAALLGGGLLTVIAITFHRVFGDTPKDTEKKIENSSE